MSLTLTDMFCGAGGSSTGAIQVPGVEVRVASNHWQLAIDTHNTNHQDADHICADLSQIDPRYFPKTDLLWASPECTNHSRAKGKKKDTQQAELWGDTLPDEAAERSRATMFDVLRFAEYHQYRAILVENVVEVCDWILFPSWRSGLEALGYRVQVVSLNSMHAQAEGLPAPQSRDRIYFLCTRKGDPLPDLTRLRPKAWCPTCDEVVRAVQAFKKPKATVGRYRSQYVYRCPNAKCRNSIVEPAWLPASSIIDWTLRGQRIGDRSKPLADKTRARIAAGIARYWSPIHLEAAGNTYDATSSRHPAHGDPNGYIRAWPMDEPMRSIHTTQSKALAVPVGGTWDNNVRDMTTEVLRTQTTNDGTGLVTPPFIAELRGGGSTARPAADPLATVTASGNHHGLVMSYYGNNDSAKTTNLPLDTVTTTDRHALLTPAGGTWNDTAYPATAPARTMTTRETTALVMRNNTGGAEMVTPASETLRTITTTGHQSVLTSDDIAKAAQQVDEVLFRMLEPSECKRAMAFPGEYVILGNRREQVRMAGNAVTPPAARDLIACVVEALGGAS